MSNTKWLWSYLKKYKYVMLTGLFLVLVASAVNMVNPYVSGIIVDKVIKQGHKELLLILAGIMIGATVFKSIIRYIFQISFEVASQGTMKAIREEMYEKLQSQDFKFFDTTRTGDIMAKMTGDIEMVRHFVAWDIYNVVEGITIFTFATCLLFTINWQFTLILLCVTPFLAIVAIQLANTVRPTFSRIRGQFSKLNSVVQENISGNRVIKAFVTEDIEIEKFKKENDEYMNQNLEAANVWAKYLPIIDVLASLLSLIIILVGGIMVINDQLTIGELVTFNTIIWALGNPMRSCGWLINDIQRFHASADKIKEYLFSSSAVKNRPNAVKKDIKGQVEFRNVSFTYGEGKVLENISFKAYAGQTIAIVGATGSGKSTLISLIPRFYNCTKGEVLLDGINVNDFDLTSLRSQVAVAMQDVFLFSDTIEGNIAYGVPNADMASIQQAAEVADAHQFICTMPDGYNTIVGERGVGLSGGQKQRIALARAVLKNPSILILDDTTSSVDMETEFKIHKMLKTFFAKKTTFLIAHRISTVKNADLILVIDDGKLVESGTHDELLKNNGCYRKVYDCQYGDFDFTSENNCSNENNSTSELDFTNEGVHVNG